MSERIYGGFGEISLRDAVAGAARGTKDRAIADLLDHVQDLGDTLRLFANPDPGGTCMYPCWCAVAPFDDGSTKAWRHDVRCREVRELLGIS